MERSSFLKTPKIIFFGTPRFSAEVLKALVEAGVQVVGVVTQPDRPRGRSLALGVSAVKELASQTLFGIPIFQPEKSSDPAFLQSLQSLGADLYVVVAFGQILPEKLLSIPPLGCINVHTSLLPKYRGAAPIQRCLMAGEDKTGVSIQKMVKQLDAGDLIRVESIQIPESMNFAELEEALLGLSKRLLLEVLQDFARGVPKAAAQDPLFVTYAHKIDPAEGEIRWDRLAREIHNQIRGLSPRPGAWTWIDAGKKKLKILRSRVKESRLGVPGEVLFKEGVVVCKEGSLQLLEVQPEGKKVMSWDQWARGASPISSFPFSIS
jgi:methionyl-tRNA formyltransferase